MKTIQTYRRSFLWILAILYLLVPFWEIGGGSALRFDVPTLRLHFFGTVLWVQEFYAVMLAILFLVLLFFLTTLLFGRVWCGWFCPQTILTDLSESLVKLGRHRFFAKVGKHLGLFLVSISFAFATICYLISPYEVLSKITTGNLDGAARGGITVITILLYLHLLFIRRTFCATICPYAKFQGAVTDKKTLSIGMDEKRRQECLHCQKCVKACPTGLDIRKGMQVGCIMCASCVDACHQAMAPSKKESLIGYRFGDGKKASRFSLARPGVIALFLLAMVPLTLFVYQIAHHSTFTFNILPHRMAPRFTKGGEVINAYILSIKNMTDSDLSLSVSLKDRDNLGLRLSLTKPLLIEAELVQKFPLFVRGNVLGSTDRKITIAMRNATAPDKVITETAYFIIPPINP